jgi:hypothetical protein
MKHSVCLFSVFCIFAANIPVHAQEMQAGSSGTMSGQKMRALILDIDARVLEEKQVVVWNETHRKLTIPGSPVGIKLVGSNIVVVAQFTPFLRRRGNVLVAHGQIWINDPEKGMSYYTSIQTIPLEFGEPVYFFPLGSPHQFDSSIEIIITVNPNTDALETPVNAEND